MAENTPIPPVPPKPSESAKVQPKKETVRINLPPKPTAAPTIKIPSPSAVAAATPAQAAPVAVTSATAAPAAAGTATTVGARPAVAAPAASARPAPRPIPAAPTISMVDQILAGVAALVCIIALVRVLMLGS
jgi:hypothetical protein